MNFLKKKLKDYYNDIAANRFKVPASFDVIEVIKKLDPSLTPKQKGEILKNMAKLKRKIKSPGDMQKISVKESEVPALVKLEGLRKAINENYRGRDFARTLKAYDEGTVQGPVILGNEALLVMVVAKNAARIKPYEEVKDKVRQEYVKVQQNNLLPQTAQKNYRRQQSRIQAHQEINVDFE